MAKEYIGDGAYVDFDGYALVVTAENGIAETDRVVLEPSVFAALIAYASRVGFPTDPNVERYRTTLKRIEGMKFDDATAMRYEARTALQE